MNKILYSHPHLWVTMQDEIATIGIKDNLIEKLELINQFEIVGVATVEEGKEIRRGRTMLRAAAMTYVASVATTLIQILRLVLIVGRRND